MSTSQTTTQSPAEQDFAAALHEVENNLDTRRLMLVVSHILVPALLMAVTDSVSGTEYPEALAWLPRHILSIVGAALVVSGALVTAVLARCHFGLVLNASKMAQVLRGQLKPQGLNWLGVTTNFTLITALSAGGGAALLMVGLGRPWYALGAGALLPLLLMAWLGLQHLRANARARQDVTSWSHGTVSDELREEHLRKSLDATQADIAIVVTMAAALFAGTFNSITNLAGVNQALSLPLSGADWAQHGAVALSAYTMLSLLLSGRMVIRLRIALASHSAELATVRSEQDQPYRFKLREKTYLLYLLILCFTGLSAATLAWTLAGQQAGLAGGAGIAVAGMLWYPLQLWRAAPR